MKRRSTQVSRRTSTATQIFSSIKDLLVQVFVRIPLKQAAQKFASIEDLLVQVFVRIPLKQVCGLKLVSKRWNSIISDPKLHLSLRNPEPAVGLIFNCRFSPYYDQSYILYFDRPTIPKRIGLWGVKLLHSCNGLLLFKSNLINNPRHCIYNPITKKTFTLDPCKSTASICGKYLAFDPSKSCHYKFVCVVGLRKQNKFKFEVYSSETGSWRKCGEPFSATVDFEATGVYWKGAIHWVSLTKAGQSIYFNPDEDRMFPTVMPSPPILEDAERQVDQYGVKRPSPPLYRGRNYHFGESCGHLNFIDSYRNDFEFNVYEMRTDYSEWFVKYRVDLSKAIVRSSFCICTLVRGNYNDDDTFLVLRVWNKFVRFNLVDKTFKTIWECEGRSGLDRELLGRDGEFPLQYIEGAYGNLDGIWATDSETTF